MTIRPWEVWSPSRQRHLETFSLLPVLQPPGLQRVPQGLSACDFLRLGAPSLLSFSHDLLLILHKSTQVWFPRECLSWSSGLGMRLSFLVLTQTLSFVVFWLICVSTTRIELCKQGPCPGTLNIKSQLLAQGLEKVAAQCIWWMNKWLCFIACAGRGRRTHRIHSIWKISSSDDQYTAGKKVRQEVQLLR